MLRDIQSVKTSIKLRYTIALAVIALLSSLAFYALISILKESKNTAYIVNISGKQRMLSQRIALEAHRIHTFTKESHSKKSAYPEQLISTLKKHIKEMSQSNEELFSGKLFNGDIISLSPEITSMYFHSNKVAQRVKEYLSLANSITPSLEHTKLDIILKKIENQANLLLPDLDRIVQQYQHEGEQKLLQLRNLEILIWISTLLVLFLELIFIFRPMLQHMLTFAKEKEKTLQSLEKRVKLRTVHLQRTNKKLEDLASHDPLTGLRNRLNMEETIESAIIEQDQNDAPFAVIMFDIDWFKKVNDTYGHDVGDLVLIELSQILTASVREDDYVYRAGGEEFVVLLNHVTYENSVAIAEKIRKKIEDHTFVCDEHKLKQTISGGLYHSSIAHADTVKTLMKWVDEALYLAKHSGRNQIQELKK